APAGTVGELPILARRADGAAVVAADDLLRLPAVGSAAALRLLRGLRRARRPARANGLHRGLHAHLVGPAPAPAARHDRAADLRRGLAGRGRSGVRGVLPGAREDVLRGVRRRPRGAELAP